MSKKEVRSLLCIGVFLCISIVYLGSILIGKLENIKHTYPVVSGKVFSKDFICIEGVFYHIEAGAVRDINGTLTKCTTKEMTYSEFQERTNVKIN